MKRLLLVLATAMLVLYKPVSSSGATGSSTATTVTLDGSYYVLQANGTLSSTTVTSISLENGEGAILEDPSASGPSAPAIARTTMIAAPVTTSPAAAIASTESTPGSSPVSPSSPVSTSREQLTAEYFERLVPGLFLPNAANASQAPMAQPVDSSVPWADLDQFFSAWVAAKMLKPQGNSSPADGSLWPAEDVVSALFSVAPLDDPLNPSSAS